MVGCLGSSSNFWMFVEEDIAHGGEDGGKIVIMDGFRERVV